MSADTETSSGTVSRAGTSTLLGPTMALVGATAGWFALGAYAAQGLPVAWGWLFLVAAISCLFGLGVAVKRSEGAAVAVLFGFGGLLGAALSPTIAYYASGNPQTLVWAAAATGLFVAGFGAGGYATRRDLSGLSRILLWALVALILFGVVLIFVQIPGGAVIYAVAGLVIFAGLTSLDFQRLRRSEDVRTAPLLAASIFLEILNVFQLFLALFQGDER